MRTIFTTLKKITAALALSLALAACSNPFEPPESSKPADSGAGTFTLQIGGVQAGRTILPPAFVQNDFAAYTLVFSASGKTDITEDRSNANLGGAVTLPAGTWNLTLTAYLDGAKANPAARGSLAGIVINDRANTSKSLTLAPVIQTGATGTFRWNIQYPADITSASMTITPLDAATGTAEQTLYFAGGTPLVEKNNATAPLSLNTGYYRVEYNLGNGRHSTGREEYLHIYQNMQSAFEYTFTPDYFYISQVSSGGDSGLGTLRYAIANAPANSTIFVESEVGTISLNSALIIDKNLTIKGNGVTLTRSAAWTTVDDTSQLLYVYNYSAAIMVNISRVHFKDGRAIVGAAVRNDGETVNLESCVFSGNQASTYNAYGGAIYNNNGPMSVKGCTFYNNSAYEGGAIYNVGTLTLTGNLFYGNTAASDSKGHVVRPSVTSTGYNIADRPKGTYSSSGQSGFNHADDKSFTDIGVSGDPLNSATFAPVSGLASFIPAAPPDFPTVDFYGNTRTWPSAPGAVKQP